MTVMRVTVDGFTYTGRWSSRNAYPGMIVYGPLEHRPVYGLYRDGEWDEESGPQGKLTSDRHRRWWKAAWQLVTEYTEATT